MQTMQTAEELKTQLREKIVEVAQLADDVMKIEGHVGAVETTVRMFIMFLHAAMGNIKEASDMMPEDFVYPIPRATIEDVPVVTIEDTSVVEEIIEEDA